MNDKLIRNTLKISPSNQVVIETLDNNTTNSDNKISTAELSSDSEIGITEFDIDDLHK